MNRSPFWSALWEAAHPFSLLSGVLLYAVGGGIADYLGHYINWDIYWLGQGAVTALQLSSYFLREYFDFVAHPPFAAETRDDMPKPPDRAVYLQVGATALTAGAVLTVLLVANGALPLGGVLILGAALVLGLGYALPPMRLSDSGYGELVQAILQMNLFPALAFLLQVGELHRLLALLTFPLTFLYLAAALARSLRSYMDDIRKNRRTMLARLGWQRGMNFHNVLIAIAYLLPAISVISGLLAWPLAFPIFFSLPVSAYQIWQINGIANGAKPRWRVLSLTAMAMLAFTAYFINLALWVG